MGDTDVLLVGKNRGFDITCLPHVGEIEIVRDQIPTSAPPTPYWGGVGLDIDRCIITTKHNSAHEGFVTSRTLSAEIQLIR